MHAVPAIVNVMLVCLIFWLIFSIVGYQLFSGKFYRCFNSETLEKYLPNVVMNKSQCNESEGMLWRNAKINFDSSLQGFLALFQVVRIRNYLSIEMTLMKHFLETFSLLGGKALGSFQTAVELLRLHKIRSDLAIKVVFTLSYVYCRLP